MLTQYYLQKLTIIYKTSKPILKYRLSSGIVNRTLFKSFLNFDSLPLLVDN